MSEEFPSPFAVSWWVIWVAIGCVTAATIGTFLWLQADGYFQSKQYQNTTHSQGYITAQNQRCLDDTQQWTSAKRQYDADIGNDAARSDDLAHMHADFQDCQRAVAPLYKDEVWPQVALFLADHGGDS